MKKFDSTVVPVGVLYDSFDRLLSYRVGRVCYVRGYGTDPLAQLSYYFDRFGEYRLLVWHGEFSLFYCIDDHTYRIYDNGVVSCGRVKVRGIMGRPFIARDCMAGLPCKAAVASCLDTIALFLKTIFKNKVTAESLPTLK